MGKNIYHHRGHDNIPLLPPQTYGTTQACTCFRSSVFSTSFHRSFSRLIFRPFPRLVSGVTRGESVNNASAPQLAQCADRCCVAAGRIVTREKVAHSGQRTQGQQGGLRLVLSSWRRRPRGSTTVPRSDDRGNHRC